MSRRVQRVFLGILRVTHDRAAITYINLPPAWDHTVARLNIRANADSLWAKLWFLAAASLFFAIQQ